jgi:16S rRNA (uracil1498-N3)-methyltransferase
VVHEPEPDIVLILVQALAKGDRDEMAVEAAVETGVDGIVPWQAERSVVIWRGERAAKSLVRWRATVRAAVKQSRRARVPPVSSAVTTAQLAALIQAAVSNNGVALVLHEDANVSLADVPLPSAAAVAAKEAARPADEVPVWADGPVQVVVIVGPEGGISDAELAALTQAGAVTVRLGPHVLRTSTAGPVAIALLSQRLGRWELS